MYKASEELPLNVQQRLVSEEQTWRLPSASTLQLEKVSKSVIFAFSYSGSRNCWEVIAFKQLLLSGSHIL